MTLPILFKGDDIFVKLTYGSYAKDIVLTDLYNNAITGDIATIVSITAVVGKILVNNIIQSDVPTVAINTGDISFKIVRADTKSYNKGLLEVELLLTLDYDGTTKQVVKRKAIGWLKDTYTSSLLAAFISIINLLI